MTPNHRDAIYTILKNATYVSHHSTETTLKIGWAIPTVYHMNVRANCDERASEASNINVPLRVSLVDAAVNIVIPMVMSMLRVY